ncbi:MAG: NAD(P)H-dependent glycerol-3-phosphate dehydrogenase [Oscillospiraceae bacterium]|nr:NAD(P)H-dependent glycerol-3-phosphate dehydrogenase [Oscillospiraceae bacterium]
MKIAVIGSGAWGTALALVANKNGHDVALWSRRPEQARQIGETHRNDRLPGVELPAGIRSTSEIACARGCDAAVVAVPSYAMRETARTLAGVAGSETLLVSVTKGIEYGTGSRMSEILEQETGRPAAVLSGPSHAEEVARFAPTGVVAAAKCRESAALAQRLFMNGDFRVYTSPDVAGVELGAALKNIIALCAGICDGLGCGDNAKALLMTRGLEETARLGLRLGARRETFAGLAGMGDLIVTCTSMHSRNRRAGILIGGGASADEALEQVGAVVEGYYAARAAAELAGRLGVEMPITAAACEVLYEGADPRLVIRRLMQRSGKTELGLAAWAK